MLSKRDSAGLIFCFIKDNPRKVDYAKATEVQFTYSSKKEEMYFGQ